MKHWLLRVTTLLTLLLIFSMNQTLAQDAEETVAEDSTAWQKSVTGMLAGSQAAYDNWQEGGINSTAFSASITGSFNRKTLDWTQGHDLRLSLGSLKQEGTEFRKADDLIQWESAWLFTRPGTLGPKLSPTFGFGLRTQFIDGFNYDEDPKVRVSSLFAPATLTQNAGIAYVPVEWFTQTFGLGAKETIVTIEDLRESYGNDPDEALRFEMGLSALSSLEKEIFQNVLWKSNLGLFAAFNQLDKPDVRWENLLILSVNDWLSVNFEFVTFYDLDISDEVQLKQVLSTGISVGLL